MLSDPALYQTTNGKWLIMLSGSNYELANLKLGGSGYTPIPLDFDGDGRVDPAVYNGSLGKWIVMLSGRGYDSFSVTWGEKGYEAVGGIK